MALSLRSAPLVCTAAVLAACLAPTRATACSCLPAAFSLPADGAAGVPTNTRIWLGGAFAREEGQVTLRDGEGTVVDVDVAELAAGSGHLRVLTPKVRLAPGRTYEIRRAFPPESRFSGSTRFTTGAAPSTAAPARLVVTDVEEVGPAAVLPDLSGRTFEERRVAVTKALDRMSTFSSCGRVEGVRLRLSADPARALVVVATEADPRPDFTAALAGEVPFLVPNDSTELALVAGGCVAFPWSRGLGGLPGTLRVGAFDLAGRFSGWSEPFDADEVILARIRRGAEEERERRRAPPH